MVTLNLGEIEFETKSDIVNALIELANAIEYGYNSGITNSGVCWDIDGEEETEEEDDEFEDEVEEFTCGNTTIDRDMYESMPSPMDTSSLSNEDMQRLAEAIEYEMSEWQEWLDNGDINQDQYDEHWWEIVEECGFNFGMTYYEDIE